MQQISISELLEQRPVIHKIQFDLKEQRKQAIHDKIVLEDLTRSRLKIAIVTETWPPEINGVAHALLQLCKGLQKQGHKILLIRPEQRQACNDLNHIVNVWLKRIAFLNIAICSLVDRNF